MSKPLELTTYQRDEDGDYMHPVTQLWTSELETDDEAEMKRFTDAELAAELWFGTAREGHAEAMGWRTGHAQDWINTNREECRIVAILERFATLPHYDEVAA